MVSNYEQTVNHSKNKRTATSMIKTCPHNPKYVFKDKCSIRSCQYHNTKTASGCLDLDLSSKQSRVSDIQLLQFKIIPNKEAFDSKALDVKFAGYARKKSVMAAKGNMVLYLFSNWIKAKLTPSEKFPYRRGVCSFIDNLLEVYPFNQPELSMEPWMIYYMANTKAYDSFVQDQNRKAEDIVPLINVLGLTPGKHKNLIMYLKQYQQMIKQFDKTSSKGAK